MAKHLGKIQNRSHQRTITGLENIYVVMIAQDTGHRFPFRKLEFACQKREFRDRPCGCRRIKAAQRQFCKRNELLRNDRVFETPVECQNAETEVSVAYSPGISVSVHLSYHCFWHLRSQRLYVVKNFLFAQSETCVVFMYNVERWLTSDDDEAMSKLNRDKQPLISPTFVVRNKSYPGGRENL